MVMCQFITFCDSASSLLRAFPLFVQLLSPFEGNVGYINTGDSLRRRLWDFSNVHHVRTTAGLLITAEMRNGNFSGFVIYDLSVKTMVVAFCFILKHLFIINEVLTRTPIVPLHLNSGAWKMPITLKVSLATRFPQTVRPKLISRYFIFPERWSTQQMKIMPFFLLNTATKNIFLI